MPGLLSLPIFPVFEQSRYREQPDCTVPGGAQSSSPASAELQLLPGEPSSSHNYKKVSGEENSGEAGH